MSRLLPIVVPEQVALARSENLRTSIGAVSAARWRPAPPAPPGLAAVPNSRPAPTGSRTRSKLLPDGDSCCA